MTIETVKQAILEAILEKQGQQVYCVPGGLLADWFVIASATSQRHLKTICEHLEMVCKQKLHTIAAVDGKRQSSNWIVLDAGGVFVHLLLKETRETIALEALWEEKNLAYRKDPLQKDPL